MPATASSSPTAPSISTSSSNPPATSADTSADASAEITHVVKAYNAAYLQSLRHPANPPDLSMYAAGTALQTARKDPPRLAAKHLALRARTKSQNRDAVYDVSVDGSTATATDCEVNDDLVVNSTTGQVVSDKVQTNQSTYTLKRDGESWKIIEIEGSPSTTWEGVSGCALSH